MKKLLILLVLPMLVSSCQITNPRFFNSPSSSAPAYLEKKGDAKLSANISFNPGGSYPTSNFDSRFSHSVGFDASTAYAVSDHFMVSLGGLYRNETDIFDTNDIRQTRTLSQTNYTRKALDIGVGTILPTGGNFFIFNPILGVNFGRAESLFKNTCDTIIDDRAFHFNGNYHKLYLRPNLNFHFPINLKLSFAPQFSLLKYNSITDNYPRNTEEGRVGIDWNFDRLQQRYSVLFEPSLFCQIGFDKLEWLKLDLGMTFSFNLTPKELENNLAILRNRGMLLSAGFSIYPWQ